jgi:hypothetical protein
MHTIAELRQMGRPPKHITEVVRLNYPEPVA